MKRLSFFLLTLALGASSVVTAQNILSDTLLWNSIKAVGQVNHDTAVYSCSFLSRGSQSIDWIQLNGARVYNYVVAGVDGQWQDLTQDGQAVFHVTVDSLAGDLTFAKLNALTTIHLSLSKQGLSVMDYVFYISDFTKPENQ